MKPQSILLVLFVCATTGFGVSDVAPTSPTETSAIRAHWTRRTLRKYLDRRQINPALNIALLYQRWSRVCKRIQWEETDQLDPIWQARDKIRLNLCLRENQIQTMPDDLRCVLDLQWDCSFKSLGQAPNGRGTPGCGEGGGSDTMF